MRSYLIAVAFVLCALSVTSTKANAEDHQIFELAERVPEQERKQPFFFLDVAAAFRMTDVVFADLPENMRAYSTFARLNLSPWDRSSLTEFLLWNSASDLAFSQTVGFPASSIKTIAGWSDRHGSDRPSLLLAIGPEELDRSLLGKRLSTRGFSESPFAEKLIWSRGQPTSDPTTFPEPEGPFVGRYDLPIHFTIDRNVLAVSSTSASIRSIINQRKLKSDPERQATIRLAVSPEIDGELIQLLQIPEIDTSNQLIQWFIELGYDSSTVGEAVQKINAGELLPRWGSVTLLDHQEKLRRMGTIALSYRNKDDAQQAISAFEQRFEAIQSIAAPGKRVAELFPFQRSTKIVALDNSKWFALVTFEHVLDPKDTLVQSHADHRPIQILIDSWLVGELSHLIAWQQAQQ